MVPNVADVDEDVEHDDGRTPDPFLIQFEELIYWARVLALDCFFDEDSTGSVSHLPGTARAFGCER